jgi:protein involved in temperature-dependent protein secretion
MKGQKQSKTEVLQNKVQALTNVIKQLITEVQANTSLAQGTLTAFQMYVGKEEWEKIIEQLKNKEKLDNELE